MDQLKETGDVILETDEGKAGDEREFDRISSERGPGKKIAALSIGLIILIAVFTGAVMWLGSSDSDEKTITLYGFSVKGEVFDTEIIPAFREYWKDKTGEDISFQTNYAGSGKITNQVIAGSPAEVMILSTEWDAMQLEAEGLVETDWTTFPENGTVSMSPWVILVRDGNPKNISDFPDLTRPGVEIVHADPQTSGGACWSVFAVYGSELKKSTLDEGSPNETAAKELLNGVVDNVISWQSSARNALSQFELGYGDALITYENEALLAISKGADYEIVYPQSTIYSEHKAVIVDGNVGAKEREVVEEFVDFLFTDEVQGYMVEYGFRSTDESLNVASGDFPALEMPFTVSYLGGWAEAHPTLIDGVFAEVKDE